MKTDELREMLLNRKQYLDKIIKEREYELKNAPDGKLRYYKSGNSYKYFCRETPSDATGTYIKKSEEKKAVDLAQKDYNQKVLETASREAKVLKKLVELYDGKCMEYIYQTEQEPKQRLIKPICLPDEEYVTAWLSHPYERKPFLEDSTEYITENGERVRSKSELIIADTLFRMGVPYRYEAPIILKGMGTIHPDFTVLNVRSRKNYYWEHLGRMDDPSYAEKAMERIYTYEKNGCFPGESLLLTYETMNQPLSTRQIKMIIERYLI